MVFWPFQQTEGQKIKDFISIFSILVQNLVIKDNFMCLFYSSLFLRQNITTHFILWFNFRNRKKKKKKRDCRVAERDILWALFVYEMLTHICERWVGGGREVLASAFQPPECVLFIVLVLVESIRFRNHAVQMDNFESTRCMYNVQWSPSG
jgi:hypothetical protein